MSSPSSSHSSLLGSKISPNAESSAPKKDFLAAFATLQAMYGFTGGLCASQTPPSERKTSRSSLPKGPGMLKRLLKLVEKVRRSNGSTPAPSKPKWVPSPRVAMPSHCAVL
ncbi:hypothetical protein MVEN_01062300 [Mycena venus]|uniref:Uncharacterized protein n=1 Tax=Mycena venus TaxID=2733690 RepID=A0A8H7CX41_9AGAR|nr:hypothetical protein MVEN_01062300 [Mycena venus]